MNKMMVPTYLHVPICRFAPCCFPMCRRSFLLVIQFSHFSYSRIFPIFHFGFSMLHMSFFLAVIQISHLFCSHIFPISPFWFSMWLMSFFCFLTTMFLVFQGGYPMINGFLIVSRPHVFPLGFVFSIRGGGRFDLATVSPNPPPP